MLFSISNVCLVEAERANQDRAMPEALEEAAGGSPLSWLALSLPYAAAAGASAFAPQAVWWITGTIISL